MTTTKKHNKEEIEMTMRERIWENENLRDYGISWCEDGLDNDNDKTTMCYYCKFCE
jgi:hypothetical protein